MPRQKSTIVRKMYGLRLEKTLMQEVQHLGVDLERNANDLIEEAMRELLKKYKKKGK
ncbi:MAG: hypothetical protein NPIRA02_40290 [Nitrospirales bacterium]|nr:MAG: hypothetical protein NPIRA02_40290 [Nitrospirales bacterium]